MSNKNDLSRCLVALEQDATLIAVIEMGQASWLVAGIVPGLDRYPLKKLGPDRDALLELLHRWRNEAAKAGHAIDRIAVAYEAGRDGYKPPFPQRDRCLNGAVSSPLPYDGPAIAVLIFAFPRAPFFSIETC